MHVEWACFLCFPQKHCYLSLSILLPSLSLVRGIGQLLSYAIRLVIRDPVLNELVTHTLPSIPVPGTTHMDLSKFPVHARGGKMSAVSMYDIPESQRLNEKTLRNKRKNRAKKKRNKR